MEEVGKEVKRPPQINVVRLSLIFLLSTLLPLLLGLFIDWLYGPSISAVAVAAVLSIPIVAVAVGWALVAEMGRVVQLVAPDTLPEDSLSEDETSATQP